MCLYKILFYICKYIYLLKIILIDLEEFEAPQWCVPIKANVMTFDWDVSICEAKRKRKKIYI